MKMVWQLVLCDVRCDVQFLTFQMISLAFIIAAGKSLDCHVVLPFVEYNPEITSITFDVEVC